MSLATPPLRSLALRLLASESETGAEANVASAVRVCEKLGAIISKLAGAAGYRSLLARALVLAQAEVPWLMTVSILPDGKLAGFEGDEAGAVSDPMRRGGAILIAQLLGLLHTFIGEPLTLQLLKEAWTDVSIH